MIQNFDKVIKYDDHVSYFNIEIHKQCHMQHMFWVKMVRFGNTFVIFTTSKKNSSEIQNVLVQNFGLNLSVPKESSRFLNEGNDKDLDVTDEDEEDKDDVNGERNPLIE